jgi:phage gpG-like protein
MTESVEALQELLTEISEIVEDADYSDVLQNFLPDLAKQHAEMFASKSDSDQSDWTPLKPSTIREKVQNRILINTGTLQNSLVHVGGPGNIHEVGPREMLFGTNVEYAGYLEDGTSRMPARPPVGISIETIDKLCNKVADATIEMLRG